MNKNIKSSAHTSAEDLVFFIIKFWKLFKSYGFPSLVFLMEYIL
jgi:hypothetical protein